MWSITPNFLFLPMASPHDMTTLSETTVHDFQHMFAISLPYINDVYACDTNMAELTSLQLLRTQYNLLYGQLTPRAVSCLGCVEVYPLHPSLQLSNNETGIDVLTTPYTSPLAPTHRYSEPILLLLCMCIPHLWNAKPLVS